MLRQPKFALLVAIVMSASMWFYVERVLIPFQVEDAAQHGRPRGVLSDLYPRWLGTRELLLERRDPYSDAVTRDIQTGYYGRVIDPNRPGDPRDEQRFAYPAYVVFLLAPLAKLPFATARIAIEWILVLATIGSIWLWLRVLRWQLSPTAAAVLFLLAINCMPSIQGIKLQQLTLLVAALIAASAVFVSTGQLVLAGVCLALASIKPQLAILAVIWLLLWTLGDWHARKRFGWGFACTMAVLLAGSEYLLPGWFHEFLSGLIAYQHYTGGVSQLGLLVSPVGGLLLTVLAVTAAVVVSWKGRRAASDSQAFAVVFAFVLAVTALIVATVAPYNQILLLPAVFVIARNGDRLWASSRLTRLMCVVAGALLIWPWMASTALMVASGFISPITLHRAWAVPLWTSLGIPISILPLIFLIVVDVARNRGPTMPESPRAVSTPA